MTMTVTTTAPTTAPTSATTATATARHPFDLPAAAYTYLERAARSLREAITSSDVPQRYAQAHVSALQATAALLAARATPTVGRPKRGRAAQKNAWVLLAEVAPELAEWAGFFAAGADKRAAAESGSRRAVTEREADDLVRDADRFLGLVEQALGLTRHAPFHDVLPAPWGGGRVA
ncbi:MAG TPA: SAV_6107 family HEPN domain-containing protein [Nocardioidaceae bacterium]|nr:SAV_6107 family HEPN domain-containing protein [Nocardioidaceae bacterium]